ncbi:putative IncC-like protein [uncultured Desulfobacterium sp.]|uniref:Putative IncC-like protein n=1 Tax=uncultured Desulfobacterium sp. TaxID=201089 RepID=A0A445MSU5_9BACT|nr:putative IncC-like protein [uncultured Desulfobacterium sp.]
MQSKIVTVAIHKGGTGKTTAAVNLSWLAQERGISCLMIDLDIQGNATDNFIKVSCDQHLNASHLFNEDLPELPAISVLNGLDLIPADAGLLAVERYPMSASDFFKTNLNSLATRYDLIVIDTPPTMGFAMLAPLTISDFTFAPIIPDAYSLKGVTTLVNRIKNIRAQHNKDLLFLGLLINRFSKRNAAQKQVVSALKENLGDFVMPISIPEHVHIEYSAHSKCAVWHAPQSGAHRAAGKTVKAVMGWILDSVL